MSGTEKNPVPVNGPANEALWRRTDAVIPNGGMYFTRSARFAGTDVMPGFIKAAEGCRVTDVDDKTYLDFNCGNGPNLLGYRHPEVDAAAAEQAGKMDLAAFFPELMPAYAERLLDWGTDFDWSVFTKNGSDSTNLAMRIMRAKRQQPYIVLFDAAYHGFGVELALADETQFDLNQQYIIRVPWNDAEALLAVADKYGEQLAGLVINPLDQSPAREVSDVSASMVSAIDTFKERTGAYVAIDDVRHGFRLHPKGSHVHMGLNPDLLCLGKALANGYSTSVVLGKQSLRQAAEKINFTATYMFSSVAFRAGIATLDIYERDHVFDHLWAMGTKLVDGINQAAMATGHLDLVMSGPPTMPTLLFSNDVKAKRARTFAANASRLGAIFHPLLNWFISYAHKEADIDEAIDIAERALRETPTNL
jgi:glutamate-1-semialdehyde 2,1-aminomutase